MQNSRSQFKVQDLRRLLISISLSRQSQSGFTLIELMVVVGISALLVGLGVAAYNDFNTRQTLITTVRRLRTDIRGAQARAIANKQPLSGCTAPFNGYQVTFNETNYTIAADCNGSAVDSETFSFPSEVSKSPPGSESITFKPRTGGADIGTDLVLTYTYRGETSQITITPLGEVL